MFQITFGDGSTLFYQGNTTLADLHEDVQERGYTVVSMKRVDAKPRRPRAFDLSQVVFDPE